MLDVPLQAVIFTNKEVKEIKAFTIPKIYIGMENLLVHAKPKNKETQAKFPG